MFESPCAIISFFSLFYSTSLSHLFVSVNLKYTNPSTSSRLICLELIYSYKVVFCLYSSILLTLDLVWFSFNFILFASSIILDVFSLFVCVVGCNSYIVCVSYDLTTFECYISSCISFFLSKLFVTLKSANVWCFFYLYFTYWVKCY